MTRPVITALATAAAVLYGGMIAMADDEKKERPTISVRGLGKISAVPDLADIQVGVMTQAPTAQAALLANNESMNRLHAILKEHGVAAKDVQTTQIQVSPQYSQPPGRRPGEAVEEFIPRVVGYRVDNSVRVTARDIGKLGALLDALVQAGANQIHGISFRVDNADHLLDEARRKAMADAKRKAEILAGEAGVVVGSPIKISEESGGPRQPMPVMMARAMAAPAPMPVAAGEQELHVNVEVVYELRLAK